MNKIKEFRTQLNLTQKQLATLMNTTQQTIGRWESGTSEPSLSNLRDLAYKLGTTTSALLGESHASRQSSNYHLMMKQNEKGLDGFWGNLGVLPLHNTHSIWYPITLGTLLETGDKIDDIEPFMFESLNNKLVFINPENVKRFVTLDDAADAFPGDWEISWHESGYESPEVYDALEIYMEETYWEQTPDPNNSLSVTLRQIIKKLVEENNLDEQAILQLTNGIRIYYSDGSIESFILSSFTSALDLYMEHNLDLDISSIVIEDDSFSMNLPLQSIAIIEFPLAKFNEALKKAEKDFEMFDKESEGGDDE